MYCMYKHYQVYYCTCRMNGDYSDFFTITGVSFSLLSKVNIYKTVFSALFDLFLFLFF